MKNGRVFDRLTGKAGMLVEDYIKLFDDHLFLDFEQTTVRTVK